MRRVLTVSLLLLLFVVLLRKSVDQPLHLPMPPSAADERARRIEAYAAEQDLVPADSVFSWLDEPQPYELALRDTLLPLREYRRCQLVVVPSFEREWAVYLTRQQGSAPELVSRRVREPLWAALTTIISDNGKKNSYSLGPEAQSAATKRLKVEVDSSQAVITGDTADVLEAVWSGMLERVRYPRKEWSGLDGVSYHVSHWSQDHGFRSGQTWSPTEGSRPYGLVRLAEQMFAFTQTPSKDAEERLQAAATALLSALEQGRAK